MAVKVNGTTVIDDNRNVCAVSVCACCIESSSTVTIPSGNTASRPTGGTGELFFDTDEGKLVAHNGTEWAVAGGSDAEAKFGIAGDGSATCTSYLIGKTNGLALCANGINSGCIPSFYSYRTPVRRSKCCTETRGGHISFGGDGSFSITVGAFKNIPAQAVPLKEMSY